jgi:hypothetical protein
MLMLRLGSDESQVGPLKWLVVLLGLLLERIQTGGSRERRVGAVGNWRLVCGGGDVGHGSCGERWVRIILRSRSKWV